MVTLKSDNRNLLDSTKYTFLSDNYSAGQSSIVVVNTVDISVNSYILLGNLGSENTEIVQVGAVNSTSQTITLITSTKFPHNESTKATIVNYNKIRWFRTTTTTYSDTNPLTGYLDIRVNQWYTTYDDETNSTGYGWFIYYNSTTAIASLQSNAIPYVGFTRDTVQQLFEATYSLLNNKELTLITQTDLYMWANEGYEILRNYLNLINTEYATSGSTSISIVSGKAEYALESDFGDLIAVVDDLNVAIPWISLTEVLSYSVTHSAVRYYIRGSVIGFVPTPDSSMTYSYSYIKRAPVLNSFDDTIDLPDGGFYCLKDFMLYRAYLKTQNPNAMGYYKIFQGGMDNMKIFSIKRDANKDQWGIADWANV